MKITSSVFLNNTVLPIKFTCDGERVSPALAFSDVPAEAKSLALIMSDPDAPSGDFVHWVIFNLPPDTINIAENQTPGGIVGKNSGNQNNYFPPCPPPAIAAAQALRAGPSGQHHYQFKVYALDLILNLDDNATKKDVEEAMKNHILAQAKLIGLYR